MAFDSEGDQTWPRKEKDSLPEESMACGIWRAGFPFFQEASGWVTGLKIGGRGLLKRLAKVGWAIRLLSG